MNKLSAIAVTLPIVLCASFVPAQTVQAPTPPAPPTKVESPQTPNLAVTPAIERPGSESFNPQWQTLDDLDSANPSESDGLFMPFPRNQAPSAPSAPSPSPPSYGPPSFPYTPPFFGPRSSSVVDPFAMLHEEMARMQQLQESMNQQMNTMMATMPGTNVQSFSMGTRGGDIQDLGDHYMIDLQMTGMDQGSTSLSVEGNQLVLQSEVHQTNSNTQGGSQYQMSFVNHVQRRWTLPPDANTAGIQSDFNGDHVQIVIPKEQ